MEQVVKSSYIRKSWSSSSLNNFCWISFYGEEDEVTAYCKQTNLVELTTNKFFYVLVAQLELELSPSKRMVTGSNPVEDTILMIKYPIHNMLVIKKVDDSFSLSYMKYEGLDTQQFVKYDLAVWEVAQILGGN